jgi:lipoprotein NlpD
MLLSGCGAHVYHRVERGETLYSIGWAYGYDYRQIAKWNGISAPYHLSPGQRLRVAPPTGQHAKPLQEYQPENTQPRVSVQKPAPVVGPSSEEKAPSGYDSARIKKDVRTVVNKVKEFFGNQSVSWQWPTREKRILQTFSSSDPTRQGLDLTGKLGTPIYAAADGKVVYAGSGLTHYGKLIIIKHNDKYLSAYAHNRDLLVTEDATVSAGQMIAEMGDDSVSGGSGRVKLHFEIRRNGKPVDPLSYLPKR